MDKVEDKLELDIYDFDKTIVPFESGTKFLFYCAGHYPWVILHLLVVLVAGLLLVLKIINLKTFKRLFFYFVKFIPCEKAVKGFWDKNESKVNGWFRDRKRKCAVISASPDFLLEDISKRLGFDYLLCTRYDEKTIKIIGENCRGEEKVKRFKSEIENAFVVDVYSDSLKHDKPIFSLANGECYNVVDKKLVPFDYIEKYGE